MKKGGGGTQTEGATMDVSQERRAFEDNYRWCDDLVSESEGFLPWNPSKDPKGAEWWYFERERN